MSHEIEIRDGQASMMYAGELPWHGLGQKVESEVTAEAAIKLAGLDWICKKQPIYLAGKNKVDGIPVIGTEIQEMEAVVRDIDDKVMGLVGHEYNIIQNKDCFGFLDEVVGSGQAIYHTAGALFGGRTIFCTIKLPKDVKIGDDLINKYLLLTSSHDRSSALHVRWTPVRVVCANTLNVAMSTETLASISIRHTKNYQDKINQARDVLRLTDAYYQRMELEFNKLLDTPFEESNMVKFTKTLFPSDGEPAGITKNKRNKLIELFNNGSGNQKVKNTKWAAFNSVTEYVDHYHMVRANEGRGVKIADARMASSIIGGGARLKQKAFDLLKVT